MTKAKKVSESIITMTELVLPHHTNPLGNLSGGQLMQWIDICAGLCALKHTQHVCVTASVDRIDFHQSIKVGDIVTLTASVNRVFNTSLEIGVKVFAESFRTNSKIHSNTAYLTFVALDENGKTVEAIKVIPETEEEKRRYEEALQRRESRLRTRQEKS